MVITRNTQIDERTQAYTYVALTKNTLTGGANKVTGTQVYVDIYI